MNWTAALGIAGGMALGIGLERGWPGTEGIPYWFHLCFGALFVIAFLARFADMRR